MCFPIVSKGFDQSGPPVCGRKIQSIDWRRARGPAHDSQARASGAQILQGGSDKKTTLPTWTNGRPSPTPLRRRREARRSSACGWQRRARIGGAALAPTHGRGGHPARMRPGSHRGCVVGAAGRKGERLSGARVLYPFGLCRISHNIRTLSRTTHNTHAHNRAPFPASKHQQQTDRHQQQQEG